MQTIANTTEDTRLTGLEYLARLAVLARYWTGRVNVAHLEQLPTVRK